MANVTTWKYQNHINVYVILKHRKPDLNITKTYHRGGHGVNMLNEIIIKVNGICKECHHKALLYDQHHNVLFCNKCGLVHQEATPPRITQLMEEVQQEKLERKKIMRKLKKQQHNQMLILNKYGNYLFNQWFYTFW